MGNSSDELQVACPKCHSAVITSVITVEGPRRHRTLKGRCRGCDSEVIYSYFPCVKCMKSTVTGSIPGENPPAREHW